MNKWIYLLPLLAIIIACGKDPNISKRPTVNKSITRAETYYDLEISEGVLVMEMGDSLQIVDTFTNKVESESVDIECNWDSDFGIITFSTDNPGSSPYPTATIDYNLSAVRMYTDTLGNKIYAYEISSLGISLQDVLIGTAEELNARTYIFPYLDPDLPPEVYITEFGSNYIEGWIEGPVYKRIFDQGVATGELVLAHVYCDFKVCTSCY